MTRTTFNVTYTRAALFPVFWVIEADVSLFFTGMDWWDDDDLARSLISIIENELGEEILLISWGVEPSDVSAVTMEQV
jgi:hypothetical protein